MGPQKTQLPPAGEFEPRREGTVSDVGDTSLSEAVATLRKRLWILILSVVLGACYGTYNAVTQPRLYRAVSTIQVHSGASNQFRLDQEYDLSGDSQTHMNTEVLILTSDTLLTNVARDLDLANNADFNGWTTHQPHRSITEPAVHDSVVGALKGGLQVTLIPRTEMMQVGYSSLSAQLSANIVNKVVDDYIQRAYNAPYARTKAISDWLSQQLDELKLQVESYQQQMMDLERRLGALGYDSSHNTLESSLEALVAAEGNAKIARITAESRYRMIAGMDPSTLEGSIEMTPGTGPGELNSLRAQLATAKSNYAQLTTQSPVGLGPNHPQAKAL